MPGPTAADIMSPLVVTLTPEAEIYSAMRTLLKKRLSGAPVIDREGTLVGMLSEKDCLRILIAEAFDGLPLGTVAGYMTSPVETVKMETSIYERGSWSATEADERLDRDGAAAGCAAIERGWQGVWREKGELWPLPRRMKPLGHCQFFCGVHSIM